MRELPAPDLEAHLLFAFICSPSSLAVHILSALYRVFQLRAFTITGLK